MPTPPPFPLLALALATLGALPVRAQDAPAALPAVTVEAQQDGAGSTDARLGAATRSGAPLAAQRAASPDTASLLQSVPGVNVNGAGGVSGLPSIRGLADERLRIQLDEMDFLAACANHMNPVLSHIDPAQVARVRMYAGAAPVSVGGDSIGGTIQVDSAPPQFAAPGERALVGGSLGGAWRSNGHGRDASASAFHGAEQLYLRYEGAAARAGNYRAARAFKPAAPGREQGRVIAGDEVASSAFRTQNHQLASAWRSGAHLLQADLGWQDIGLQAFPNQRMDMTANRATRLNLRYTGQHDWGELKLRAWNHHVRHAMDMAGDRYSYGTGMPMNTHAATRGAAVQAHWLVSQRDTLRLGAEGQRYTLYDWWPPVGMSGAMAPDTFWNIDYGRRNKASAFAEWERQWDARWSGLLGLRHTRVMTDAGPVQGYSTLPTWAEDAAAFNALQRRRDDRHWDVTALASFTPDAGQRYEAGLARKTRSPSLYQRYPWSTNTMAAGMNNYLGDGNGYLGNVDLRPETAHTLSASGEWAEAADAPAWALKATAHISHVKDYIDAVRCPTSQCRSGGQGARDQFVILRYANQDARLWGLELSGHWQWAHGPAAGTTTLSGSATWLRGKNLETGDGLYNLMPPNLKLSLERRVAAAGGAVTAALDWQGVMAKTRTSQVRNEIQTPGYGLLGLRGSYEVGRLRLDAGIENLLNQAYALPLGGAYIGQGSTMMLNTVPWGVAVPGRGRSLYVALTARF